MAAPPEGCRPLPSTASTRRTRFVCVSDTHNATVKLPAGDVLIHAGDLTNQGSYSELSKAVEWLEKADFEVKIVIAGNHDTTLDKTFYAEHGQYIHNQSPQDPDKCLGLFESSSSITYLCHEAKTIRLRSLKGPRTTFTVFGSPYSPQWDTWAFGYRRSSPLAEESSTDLSASSPSAAVADGGKPSLPLDTELWSHIPLDTDIVVTHTPPHAHCDEASSTRRACGCEALRRALWRVRPRLAVCGHIHEGRGAERVLWDIDGRLRGTNTAYGEAGVEGWNDPGAGNAKLSLVDLTGRQRGTVALHNDGSAREPCSGEATAKVGDTIGVDTAKPGIGVLGLGGDPASPRSDREALLGRMGRRETCIVNCAITANSYPHIGGRRFNKPIVVDLDLPVSEYPSLESLEMLRYGHNHPSQAPSSCMVHGTIE